MAEIQVAGGKLLPQSNALAEAAPESLQELFSRDPEGYRDQDKTKVWQALRDQRARFEKAEQESQGAKRAPKQEKLPAKALLASKPEELGL